MMYVKYNCNTFCRFAQVESVPDLKPEEKKIKPRRRI